MIYLEKKGFQGNALKILLNVEKVNLKFSLLTEEHYPRLWKNYNIFDIYNYRIKVYPLEK